MTTATAITPSAATAQTTAPSDSNWSLDTQDFLQLMITELTNQDPFEPIKNQDLLNQMSTIQQLQSNQNMNGSFEKMIDRLDSFLNQQRLSDATALIDQMVTGTTTVGTLTYGQVVAVSTDGGNIQLELDNGWTINLDDVTGFGGTTTEDLVGTLVMGTAADGSYVVGTVQTVQMSQAGTNLILDTDPPIAVPYANAVPLNSENAPGLVGYYALGTVAGQPVAGIVQSVSFTADQTILVLASGQQLPLDALTGIRNINPNTNS